MSLPPTLLLATWRHMLRHPWQLGLALLGIALGVAVVVSIDLASASAQRALRLSAEGVAGAATHQVVAGSAGLPEQTYVKLRVQAGVRAAAPVVQGHVSAPAHGDRTLRVLGVDPFAEGGFRPYLQGAARPRGEALGVLLTRPGAVLISADLARTLGLAPGDTLALATSAGPRTALVAGVLEARDELQRQALQDLLIADLATAQELLDRVGRLTRIDLIAPPGAAGEALLERVRSLMPASARITRAEARTRALGQMTGAFDLNLRMLSLLALVVGMFLIYNTMSFSVVQRRSLLGSLRALGASRGQVFALVMGEALALGLAGTVLGLALGVLLAEGFLELMSRTINDLYYALSVRQVSLSAPGLAKGAALGVLASALAAAAPAWEATHVPPRVALSRSWEEDRARSRVPALSVAGLLALAAAGALLALPGASLAAGFAALFAVMLGFALLGPGVTLILSRLAARVLGLAGGALGSMAARAVGANLSRTGLAVVALAVAVSTAVGVGIMVDSFRQSVAQWLAATLRADIYVSAPAPPGSRSQASLDPVLVQRLVSTAGVAEVSSGRFVDVESAAGPVRLNVFELPEQSRAGFRLLAGRPGSVWPAFEQGGAVLISEPFAFRHALAPGDAVALRTPQGLRAFPVAGVYQDYGSERGVVSMSRRTYAGHWDDPAVNALGIYAREGADLEALSEALRARAAGLQGVIVRSNRDLREASLEVFDRTFTITLVLRMLATTVAFVGVLSALMALQLERAREVAILRASGLTVSQVWALVGAQTGLLGLIAGLLAAPLGLAMALILVLIINRRSFGWTLQVHVDPALLGQALALALVAALLAGLYPAWRMGRTSPALALRAD